MPAKTQISQSLRNRGLAGLTKYYAFHDAKLDDMSSDGPFVNMNIQVKNVNELIRLIQQSTGLRIELLYDNDDIGVSTVIKRRSGLEYYNPTQSSTYIWLKLSKADYFEALRNCSPSLLYDKTNGWGIISGEETLSKNDSLKFFDLLLRQKYPWLF